MKRYRPQLYASSSFRCSGCDQTWVDARPTFFHRSQSVAEGFCRECIKKILKTNPLKGKKWVKFETILKITRSKK